MRRLTSRVSVVLAVDVAGAVVVVGADDVLVLVWVVVWRMVCVVVMVVVCVLVCVVVATHVVSSPVFSVSLPAVNTICESAQVVRFARHSTFLNLY